MHYFQARPAKFFKQINGRKQTNHPYGRITNNLCDISPCRRCSITVNSSVSMGYA